MQNDTIPHKISQVQDEKHFDGHLFRALFWKWNKTENARDLATFKTFLVETKR